MTTNNENTLDTSAVSSKQILDMFTVANEFCLFIEEIEKYEKEYIIEYLQRVLPLLYIKGTLLPETEKYENEFNERYVVEETWEYVFNSTKNMFGKDNLYYFWNSELKEASESTVSENIADMYQDLKDFIFLYSKPAFYAKANAIQLCNETFRDRWGAIIPILLKHFHDTIFSKKNSFID